MLGFAWRNANRIFTRTTGIGRRAVCKNGSIRAASRECSTLTTRVLNFWFGAEQSTHDWYHNFDERKRFWYAGGAEVDDAVREQFGSDIEAAVADELDDLADGGDVDDTLALIILLDQMTRNAYRGTAEAFSGDRKAVLLARRSVVERVPDLKDVPPVRRLFFFMPLMHSEHISDQNLCVEAVDELIAQLETLGPEAEECRKEAVTTRQHAVEHRDTIRKFGRYPHRNEALGRESTNEELKYLEKANRYGQ